MARLQRTFDFEAGLITGPLFVRRGRLFLLVIELTGCWCDRLLARKSSWHHKSCPTSKTVAAWMGLKSWHNMNDVPPNSTPNLSFNRRKSKVRTSSGLRGLLPGYVFALYYQAVKSQHRWRCRFVVRHGEIPSLCSAERAIKLKNEHTIPYLRFAWHCGQISRVCGEKTSVDVEHKASSIWILESHIRHSKT